MRMVDVGVREGRRRLMWAWGKRVESRMIIRLPQSHSHLSLVANNSEEASEGTLTPGVRTVPKAGGV